MELAIALIVLLVGLTMERGRLAEVRARIMTPAAPTAQRGDRH